MWRTWKVMAEWVVSTSQRVFMWLPFGVRRDAGFGKSLAVVPEKAQSHRKHMTVAMQE
jgi:hypothetical protein